MAFSLRSLTWPGQLAHARLGKSVSASLRPSLGEAFGSAGALPGYSLLTGIGLLLGFAREVTVASTFGLSPDLDVFVAVMSFHLFFGAQIGNALETAFIARTAKYRGRSAVIASLKPALCGLLAVNAGVVLCLWWGAGPMLRAIFPRFDASQQALAAHTLHALLLPIVFASTGGLLRGALAISGSFAPGFLAGSVVSICTIVSILAFSSRLGIDALALGVAAGNLCVLGMFAGWLAHVTRAARGGRPGGGTGGWFTLWSEAASVLAGELVYATITLTERSLASQLPPGSVAGFFYAGTIVSVPLSLLAVPLATVAFPPMVEAFGRDVKTGLAQLRAQSLLVLTATVAAAATVAWFAYPIVEAVFVRGRFSPEHARLTASVLSVTMFALPFMSLGRLLRNACYALSDYRTPVAGLAVHLGTLAGLGAVLVPHYEAVGLAFAMVAGEATDMLTMAAVLRAKVRSR